MNQRRTDGRRKTVSLIKNALVVVGIVSSINFLISTYTLNTDRILNGTAHAGEAYHKIVHSGIELLEYGSRNILRRNVGENKRNISDSEGVPSESGYKFRIHVFGWRRLKSMQRLCDSLINAHYDGVKLDIHFFLDGDPLPELATFVKEFRWPYGRKFVTIREERLGLVRNLPFSWEATEDELCFFFEDDVEVSPFYFRWTQKVLKVHNPKTDPLLLGLSLVGVRLNQHIAMAHQRRLVKWDSLQPVSSPRVETDKYGWNTFGPIVDFSLYGNSSLVAFQASSSWGSLYFPNQWRRFCRYLHIRDELSIEEGRLLAIPHSNTVFWKRSWKLFLQEFMLIRGLYLLYPNMPNQVSWSTTHREKGEHTGKRGKAESVQDELTDEKNWLFTLPLDTGEHTESFRAPESYPIGDHYFQPSSLYELQLQGCAYRRLVSSNLKGEYPRLWEALIYGQSDSFCQRNPQRWKYEPFLTVSTTMARPKPGEKEKMMIASNVIRSLTSSWPHVQSVVFSSAEDCKFFRGNFLVDCVAIEEECIHPKYHLPHLNCIFQGTQQIALARDIMFVNGDIVILTDLEPILKDLHSRFPHFLSVGQRVDYHGAITGEWDFSSKGWREQLIQKVESNSSLHSAWGVDYFLSDRFNPYIQKMPPLLVGRTRWDNWVVKTVGLDKNNTVIDTTEKIYAVHLKLASEKYFTSHQKVGNDVNMAQVGFDYRMGTILNAEFRYENGKLVQKKTKEDLWDAVEKQKEDWLILSKAEEKANFTLAFHSVKKAKKYLEDGILPSVEVKSNVQEQKKEVKVEKGGVKETKAPETKTPETKAPEPKPPVPLELRRVYPLPNATLGEAMKEMISPYAKKKKELVIVEVSKGNNLAIGASKSGYRAVSILDNNCDRTMDPETAKVVSIICVPSIRTTRNLSLPLDYLLKDQTSKLLLRLDTHGHDVGIVLGASGLFRKKQIPYLITTFAPALLTSAKESPLEYLRSLSNLGFTCHYLQFRDASGDMHTPTGKEGLLFAQFVDHLNSPGRWTFLLCSQ